MPDDPCPWYNLCRKLSYGSHHDVKSPFNFQHIHLFVHKHLPSHIICRQISFRCNVFVVVCVGVGVGVWGCGGGGGWGGGVGGGGWAVYFLCNVFVCRSNDWKWILSKLSYLNKNHTVIICYHEYTIIRSRIDNFAKTHLDRSPRLVKPIYATSRRSDTNIYRDTQLSSDHRFWLSLPLPSWINHQQQQ